MLWGVKSDSNNMSIKSAIYTIPVQLKNGIKAKRKLKNWET